MRISPQETLQGFVYNFAVDGGSGTIYTGIQLLPNTKIYALDIWTVTALTSSGAAVINIGTVTTPTLFYSGAYTLFTSNQAVSVLKLMDTTLNINITITGAALTAGSFQCMVKGFYPV